MIVSRLAATNSNPQLTKLVVDSNHLSDLINTRLEFRTPHQKLSKMKFFATLPEDAQEYLLQHVSALHIEHGGIIVAKDEFPDACPIIVSGKADVLLKAQY